MCYGTPSRLQFGDRLIWSESGVQQGDPLGPVLFCLAIHPLLMRIQEASPALSVNAWYLDDGLAAGQAEDVIRALQTIEHFGPSLGLHLNAKKSEVWSPSGEVPEPLRHFHVLEPAGFELLGSPVGNQEFTKSFFLRRMTKFRALWAGISSLDHLQTQALLLRFCASFCKVVHLFRTVPTGLISEELAMFDKEFRGFMETVTGPVSDFTWTFMSLSCARGGLGLRSAQLHALGGYISSLNSAAPLIIERFSFTSVPHLNARLDLLKSWWSSSFGSLPTSLTQKALSAATDEKVLPILTSSPSCPPPVWIDSIQSPTSSCFWKCLPSRWNGTFIDNNCFRTLLHLRYRHPLFYPSPFPSPNCPGF